MTPRIRTIVGVLVSALLLLLLVRSVPLVEVWSTLREIRLGPLLGLVVLHGVLLVLRVRRWEWIAVRPAPAGRLPGRAAWDSMFVGWFANFALPAKLGEIARPFVYSRATGRPFAGVLGGVALERVLDLLALGVLFWLAFGVLPGAEGAPEWVPRFARLGGAATIGGFLGLAGLWRWGPREGTIGRFREGLELFDRPVVLARVLGWTALVWATELVVVVLTLRVCGIAGLEALPEVAAAASQAAVSTLAVALPAAPGGIGVDQWATILALQPFGVDKAAATAVSLVDMAAVLVWVLPLGFVAFVRQGGRGLAETMEDGTKATPPP